MGLYTIYSMELFLLTDWKKYYEPIWRRPKAVWANVKTPFLGSRWNPTPIDCFTPRHESFGQSILSSNKEVNSQKVHANEITMKSLCGLHPPVDSCLLATTTSKVSVWGAYVIVFVVVLFLLIIIIIVVVVPSLQDIYVKEQTDRYTPLL